MLATYDLTHLLDCTFVGTGFVSNSHLPHIPIIRYSLESLDKCSPYIFININNHNSCQLELVHLSSTKHCFLIYWVDQFQHDLSFGIDGVGLCINRHSNVVIHLACSCFPNCFQKFTIVVWRAWYVCYIFASTGSLSI